MPREFDDLFLSEYLDSFGEPAKRRKLNILLLGPGTNKENRGAKLRKYISSRCKGERNAIYGERKNLINAFRKKIGRHSDLCSYEFHLATKVVDAIIIIPDSAGSLVELGMFSDKYHIHPRTLVLFSNEYLDNEPDFISLGPKKSYDNGRAFVKTVDYSDKKLVWDIVDDFLSIMKSIKFGKHMEL